MTPRAILAAAVVLAASSGAADAADRWRLDPEHLSIGFSVAHIGYADVQGLFTRAEGGFTYDEKTRTLSDLVVTVATDSVFTAHEKRDEHVRSDQFLDAGGHPEIRFVMTRAVPADERTGKIEGDLTIRGITRPVVLDVTLNKIGPYPFGSNYVLGASATTTIRRSEFGMTYAVENGWVGDEVAIRIGVEAIRE